MHENFTITINLTSQYWKGEKTFEIPSSIAEIEFANLEEEMVKVTSDYSYIFELYELARHELEKYELRVDVYTSTVYESLKRNNEKATETALKHKLTTDSKINDYKKGLADLRHKERILYVLVKSLDMKSNQLRSLSARRNAEYQAY